MFQREVAALLIRDEQKSKLSQELENQLRELETTSKRISEERSELEHRQRRAIQKFKYEEKQLRNEIQTLHQREQDLGSILGEAIRYQRQVQENLNRLQHATSILAAQKKENEAEPTQFRQAQTDQLITSRHDFKVWLSQVRELIGTPMPGQANEIGFVATPVSLVALSELVSDRSEQSIKSVLRDGQWIDEELALFARRKSKLVFRHDRQFAAEIALSGIVHSLRADNTTLVDRQVLSFLDILAATPEEYASDANIVRALQNSLDVCLQ